MDYLHPKKSDPVMHLHEDGVSRLHGFREGELVRLKSGGPAMVAETSLRDDDAVSCVWFNGATVSRDAFDWRALERVGC